MDLVGISYYEYRNKPPAEYQAPIFVGPDAKIREAAYSKSAGDLAARMKSISDTINSTIKSGEAGQYDPGTLDGKTAELRDLMNSLEQLMLRSGAFAQSPDGLTYMDRVQAANETWQAAIGSLDEFINKGWKTEARVTSCKSSMDDGDVNYQYDFEYYDQNGNRVICLSRVTIIPHF
jgi:hypothetical protein